MRKRRGFTLVEILVVLGVIALLAAILLPAFATVRASGRSAVCGSNLKQIGAAVAMYIQDYDYFPLGVDPSDKYTPQIWNGVPEASNIANLPLLNTVLDPYLKNANVWQCPADTGFDICDLTGQPLNAHPTCYDAFTMSYFYHTDLALLNLAVEHLPDPSNTNLLTDGSGAWHGSGIDYVYTYRRYNLLYADFHLKNVNWDTYMAAWATPTK